MIRGSPREGNFLARFSPCGACHARLSCMLPFSLFIEKTAPTVNLVVTKDYEDSLTRLVRGDADAAALNNHVGTHMAARLYPGQVVHSPKLLQELPLAVAVTKGRGAELVARLNAGIAAIRADGTWQQINDRWTSQPRVQ